METDNLLLHKHKIEEAMTNALLRTCPQKGCGKTFYKEEGCNKMTCPCGQHTCYVCNKAIKDYDHFGAAGSGKCVLHDDTMAANNARVNEALKIAQAEVAAKEGVEINVKDLHVALPARPIAANGHYQNRVPVQLNPEQQAELINQQRIQRAADVQRQLIRLREREEFQRQAREREAIAAELKQNKRKRRIERQAEMELEAPQSNASGKRQRKNPEPKLPTPKPKTKEPIVIVID